MINVTKTYLPNKQKYLSYIDEIFERGRVTNNGPLVRELERRLVDYLGVKNIVLVANGTIALEIAYRLLKLTGEVITTPFSFVATTSSLVSNGLKPVFADISADELTINPQNIESKVTKLTSAILPVHVFGNACNVEEIEKIATRHSLGVIYDAAHAFGVNYKNKSLLLHGRVSTLSFHATKLFHSIEGGAMIINDSQLVEEARHLINFGIDGPDSVKSLGTNAKMNEFEAAMGLCVLDDIDYIFDERKKIFKNYQKHLGALVSFQKRNTNGTQNYSYCPVVFETDNQRVLVQQALNNAGIFPRRYFNPSLDTLPYLESTNVMTNSRDISSRILALPMYPGLTKMEQKTIISVLKNTL